MKPENIKYLLEYWKDECARYDLCARILNERAEKLSEDIFFSPSYCILVTVKHRDDLTELMTLAPIWEKSKADEGIYYTAQVEGQKFMILAKADALPGTCKLVEEEVVVPAEPERVISAKPERVEKRMVLKCEGVS